jgi:hypothetical protein
MELERLLVKSADKNRGGAYPVITATQTHTRKMPLVDGPVRSAASSPSILSRNTH